MELHPFNPRIREKFGTSLTGLPKFRIARRMLEKRIPQEELVTLGSGKFNVSGGEIYEEGYQVRPTGGNAVEVKKYEYIPDEIWILERLVLGNENPELVDQNSFEPVYVFWHDTSGPKDFSYKEPEWWAVEFLINVCVHGPKATKQMMEEQDRKEQAARRAQAYSVIDNASPYIAGKIHDGSGIVVPGNYKG